MGFIDQIEKVQGQALDTITDTQKRALEVNDKVADAVKGRVPAALLNSGKLPLTGILPTPTEGVKLYFDFAGKLLKANRSFAEQLVSAWDVAPKKTAAKASATKVTATFTAPTFTAPTFTAPKVTAPKVAVKTTAAKKSTARKTAAKKSTARKTAAKKSTARKTAA